VPLTSSEIENIEKLIAGGRLTEIVIEQDGRRTVIGGSPPALADPIAITAPSTGTITFGDTIVGKLVEHGHEIAQLSVLGSDLPVTSPQSGRITAILAEQGTLVGYGTELILLVPEASS
jgi:biotin carboxyl carrier protein